MCGSGLRRGGASGWVWRIAVAVVAATFVFFARAGDAVAADHTVTASSMAYVVDGVTGGALNLVRGQTYTISINTGTSPGHPLYIQTVTGIGGTQYSTGVSAQGVMNGSITFAVDASAPSQLYYQCGYHGGMYGPINITGCASACPGDACNTGVCNADGTCSKVPVANNTPCNDGNACTQTDTCQAGVCKGSNPKSCPAIDQCHVAGSCDPASGCPTPQAAGNGTSCNDGDACTLGDTCQSGVCTAGSPMSCSSPPTVCQTTDGATCSGGTCAYPYAIGKPCHSDPNYTGQTCDASHSCSGGQLNQGGVYMWGLDASSQLGDGLTANVAAPKLLTAANTNNLVAVAAGADHTLALDASGTAWGWGSNAAGQLVPSSPSNIPVTAPVAVFQGAVAVAAGNELSVVLDANGHIRSFGISIGSAAIALGGSGTAIAIAAGSRHGVALASDGKVWTWGANGSGQLGNGTYTNSNATAVAVSLPRPARAIAAGEDFTLALLVDGTVYAWGGNDTLQLAQPSSVAAKPLPVPVAGLANVRAIAAGGWHAMALGADGTVRTWGDNSYGELGTGVTGGMSSAVTAITMGHVASIAAGFFTSVALRADGSVWTWGSNDKAQLGNPGLPTGTPVPTPQQVPGLAGVASISAGDSSIAAIKSTGTIVSFGENTNGQLGNGQTPAGLPSSALPVSLAPLASTTLPPFKAVSSGAFNHRLALASDGTVWAWGSNTYGELGRTGPDSPNPLQVAGIDAVIAVYAGDSVSFALRADGTLWAWGSNAVGNLANGTTSSAVFATPTQIPSLSNVIDLGAHNSTLALLANGSVYAWGWNRYDQCGYVGGTAATPLAVALPASMPFARAVSTGTYNAYVLLGDGTVAGMGRNDAGELGTGSTYGASASLVIVPNLTGVSTISAGFRFVLATSGGYAIGWGYNTSNQLGSGASQVLSPIALASPVRSVSAGKATSYLVYYDGSAYAVGSNGAGALGSGSASATGSSWTLMSTDPSVMSVSGGYYGGEALMQ
jgi:alpha-tubulin suppressor-like RCC1 family protein